MMHDSAVNSEPYYSCWVNDQVTAYPVMKPTSRQVWNPSSNHLEAEIEEE